MRGRVPEQVAASGSALRRVFHEVVVGIDFSQGGVWATDLARRLTVAAGRITLVHVIVTGEEIDWRADRGELLAAQGQSMWLLDRERRLVLVPDPERMVTVRTQTIVAGSAAHGLAHAARTGQADLVVIGAPRRRRRRPASARRLRHGPWTLAVATGDGGGKTT